MKLSGRRFGVLMLAATILAGVGWSFGWPWGDDSARFCDALRSQQPDREGLLAGFEAFVAAAPSEIRRDAEDVRDFTRGLMTGKFPGASGPGVAILAMNPDLVAAQERIAACVKSTCGVAIPGAASTDDAADPASSSPPDPR